MKVEELKTLPDKLLHCLARTFQDEIEGTCVKCLYCKYAIECAKAFKDSKQMLFFDVLDELKSCTSVDIFLHPETKNRDILNGSWVEKYPELMKMLTNKSFDEQQDILKDPDILHHIGSQ